MELYNAVMRKIHTYSKLGITHHDITAFAEGQHAKYLGFQSVLSADRSAKEMTRKFAQVTPGREILDRVSGETTRIPEMVAARRALPIVGVQLERPNAVQGGPMQYAQEMEHLRKSREHPALEKSDFGQ